MMTTEEWNDKPAGNRAIRTAAEMREAAALVAGRYHEAPGWEVAAALTAPAPSRAETDATP